MTRTYAAKRLLEHGQLTFSEFMEITGWGKRIADRALQRLLRYGQVKAVNIDGKRMYRLTDFSSPFAGLMV